MVQEDDSAETPKKLPIKKIEFVQSKTRLEGTFQSAKDNTSVVITDIVTERPIYNSKQFRSASKSNVGGSNKSRDDCESRESRREHISASSDRNTSESGVPIDVTVRNQNGNCTDDRHCTSTREGRNSFSVRDKSRGRRERRRRHNRGGRRRAGRKARTHYDSDFDSCGDVGLNGPPEKVQRISDSNDKRDSYPNILSVEWRTVDVVGEDDDMQISSKYDRKTYQSERSEIGNGDIISDKCSSPAAMERRKLSCSDDSLSGPGLEGGGLGSGATAGNSDSQRMQKYKRRKSRGGRKQRMRLERSLRENQERDRNGSDSNRSVRLPKQFANVSERFIERALKLILNFVKDDRMKELRFENILSHDEQNIIFNFFNSNPVMITRYLSGEARQAYQEIVQLGQQDKQKYSLETVWLKGTGKRRRHTTKKLLTLVKPTTSKILQTAAISISSLRSDAKTAEATTNESPDERTDSSSDSGSSSCGSKQKSFKKKLIKPQETKSGSPDREESNAAADEELDENVEPSLTPPRQPTEEKSDSASGNPKMSLMQGLSKKVESSVASRMMELMGWKGGALGRNGEGIVEPLQPNLDQGRRKGLGHLSSNNRIRKRRRDRPERKEKTSSERNSRKGGSSLGTSWSAFRLNILRLLYKFIRDDKQSELPFEAGLTADERRFIENLVDVINDDKKFSPTCAEEMHLFDDIMTWKEPAGYTTTRIGSKMQLVILKDTNRLTTVLTPVELCKSSRDLHRTEAFRKNLLNRMSDFVDNPEKVELKIGGGFTPDEKTTLSWCMTDPKRGFDLRHRDESDMYKNIFQNRKVELKIEKCTSKKDTSWLWIIAKSNINDKGVMSVSPSDI